MSKLNDAIKPWLLANDFKEKDKLKFRPNGCSWDYIYYNGEYYIYFDEWHRSINARYNDGEQHRLFDATAEQVIAYFTEYSKAPEQETKQADVPLAQQMWDYLLSIGFEEIDNNDIRLGCHTSWRHNIAKGNLCAYIDTLSNDCILLTDISSDDFKLTKGILTKSLNIYSVSNLQEWLQDNGYLDDNNEEQMSNNTTKFRVIAKLQKMQQQIDLLTNKSKKWKKRAKKAEKIVNKMSKVVVY